MVCKTCKEGLFFTDPLTEGENSFCSKRCLKIYYRYNEFDRWFRNLLRNCDQCFERDILRDTKDVMWKNWCKREAEC